MAFYIDNVIKPTDTDHTAAFIQASAFDEIILSNREYVMNGEITIKANQVWRFNGARIRHTDPTKTMFSASQISGFALLGPVVLQGTLTEQGTAAEKGIFISGCSRYHLDKVTAQLFLGIGIHIAPGNYQRYKSDQGRFSDCSAHECMTGLQIDVGTGAEYNLFSNFSAAGNIAGARIGAGNTTIMGGNFSENTYAMFLSGGSNNGHGIMCGVNFNHNNYENLRTDGVTNGFTFSACHFYGDSTSNGVIRMINGSTDVAFDNCVIDSTIIHDTAGTNRATNCKRYLNFGVSGSNVAGFIQAGNY